jgi:transposase InsO family protein
MVISLSRKHLNRSVELAQRAHVHRVCPTHTEAKLWEALRSQQLGVAFRRQVLIGDRFIADFVAPLGALGQHGSSAVIERFNRTLKDEFIQRIIVQLRLSDFNEELIRYVIWYNEHRPHQTLHGRTPNEVYESRFPAREGPRLEPRPKYPLKARDGNQPSTLVRRAANLQVVVTYLDDRRRLPIISLKQAA